MSISRKQFLKWMGVSLAAAAMPLACTSFEKKRAISGSMVNPSAKTGHMLRKGGFPAPSASFQNQVIIVGAGISGLSAARWLQRNGIDDFRILDLEANSGGNSTSGKNEISAYPWAAHYLPLPDPANQELLDFLQEINVITGFSANGLPKYRSEYLCQAPQERLLMHGVWQSSLIPQTGVSTEEKKQTESFFSFIKEMQEAIGSDGKPAFAIPLDRSSIDPAFRELDQVSFADFLDGRGWTATPLRWYLDYCCRDDYGAKPAIVSAWAGIHYFAARTGKSSGGEESEVLTWPEGNARLADKLYQSIQPKFQGNSLVYKINNLDAGVEVLYFDVNDNRTVRIVAENVIFAGPHFISERLMPERKIDLNVHNGPWVVANITLDCAPGHREIAKAWDSVAYGSDSLGYISALHQNLIGFPGKKSVITWYKALTQGPPHAMRQMAFQRSWEDWKEEILQDLSRMHLGIRDLVRHIDVRVWGHGMAAPVTGLVWGEARQQAMQPLGKVHFAHTDLSGISIFEEGFYQGIRAAKEVLTTLQN